MGATRRSGAGGNKTKAKKPRNTGKASLKVRVENRKTVDIFVESLQKCEATWRSTGLWNFTFWCGAGFCKAWDSGYPTGRELFAGAVSGEFDVLSRMCRLIGVDASEITMKGTTDLVYALDTYAKYDELQTRYVDDEFVRKARSELVEWVVGRLESCVENVGYVDPETYRFELKSKPTASQKAILNFFHLIHDMGDGSQGVARGVRPHFITTNYDFVVETILDSILQQDDSHLLYTYRGFTPTRIDGFPPTTHDHWLVHQLLKINGGLEIFDDVGEGAYHLDYKETKIENRSARRKLVLPSRSQDYSDRYSRTVFRKAVRLLRETDVLVVVGYSFPEEDAALRFLVRQLAEMPEDALGKLVVYVDLAADSDRILQIFPRSRLGDRLLRVEKYVGGFDEFARDVSSALRHS